MRRAIIPFVPYEQADNCFYVSPDHVVAVTEYHGVSGVGTKIVLVSGPTIYVREDIPSVVDRLNYRST